MDPNWRSISHTVSTCLPVRSPIPSFAPSFTFRVLFKAYILSLDFSGATKCTLDYLFDDATIL